MTNTPISDATTIGYQPTALIPVAYGDTTPKNMLASTLAGGVTGSGTANIIPTWATSTSLGDSDFQDTLTVSGSATAVLQDTAGFAFTTPGLAIQGTAAGILAVGPVSTGDGAIEIDTFGSGFCALGTFSAGGTRGAPTYTPSGQILALWESLGWTGSGPASAMTMQITAESNFNGSPTSKIDFTNASDLGWHISASGTVSFDNGISVGTGTATATAGAATLNKTSGIITSEGLTGATTYSLTLTNSFIQSTSVIQVSLANSAGTNTWLTAKPNCSNGSAVIAIAFGSALTGTAEILFTVHN